jgi:RNA polymerase sigma-70 factor (ECF subfamily)
VRSEAGWSTDEQVRLRSIFDEHFDFVWRYIRRLGLMESDADDAAQQSFLVLARRLGSIELGKERSFLCGTAVRVVSEHRRAARRRREVLAGDRAEPSAGGVRPDDLVDRERARALLDQVLDAMDIELRAVFVLFELEEMAVADIAELLELPTGTAASRLRRARQSFRAIVKRFRARGTLPGECP